MNLRTVKDAGLEREGLAQGAKIGYDTVRKLMDFLGVRLAAPRNERPL